ncbi:MAG: sporulation peptidase YabG [Bacilli bacterium]|nr:sporulation peptidase YabG [Bacilli bacterium]
MIEIGNYVTRNSYSNDTIFKVINRKKDILYLKGVEYRLYADAPVTDCVLVDEKDIKDDFEPEIINYHEDRSEYFYLPGKILHLDGDESYLKRCMKYYKDNNVFAIGKKIDEKTISSEINDILMDVKPDILIITGHDAYYKKNGDKKDIKSYQNSENFFKAVKEARKYEKSHDKLIIIAGACQSDYEDLIKAGANFASSPKRINIHALDPAIIATNLALTERNKEINLIDLLSKTRNGKDGMGGLICTGTMFVGYPR